MRDQQEQAAEKDESFRPETGFESESSVSDKAFFQEPAINPVVEDGQHNEEYAAELTAPRASERRGRTEREGAGEEKQAPAASLGYVAIFLAVLSLFLLPGMLGPVSAVVGFMAFVNGSRKLGVWSIVLGTIAFVSFLTTIRSY
ncbi:hypothetical protein [Paenibacillus thermotolerans]|uniref:hypothetical protein n=1 Tax=Paenibacillus thermotolerans TaxID=3027807 RepID=UPI002368A525|nr:MULTISPECIES: hypothetical protein [unclassified Paenibacillus]